MNRQEKQACMHEVERSIAASSALFVISVKGLTVSQMQQLRTRLRQQQGKLQVVKNTLSQVVVEKAQGLSDLAPALRQQVALVYAQQDPAIVARILCEYSKEVDKLNIVAGALSNQVINKEMVHYLGSLPPYQVVVAQFCGALRSPIALHVGLMRQLLTRFVYVVSQIKHEEANG